MADAFYDNYRNLLVGNGTHTLPDLDTDDIRCGLRDEDTTALNLSTQIDEADVDTAHVAQSAAGVTATAGAGGPSTGSFDFADHTLSGVSGASVESIDIYYHTGTNTTSPLICNLDSWTNLPFTPNGGDVILQPNASGVFVIT